uniref:Uncharacterized protein n=1 Tax=Arundo donax TaxID=35708 RepID=A0A0A9FIV8_ARUDO
MDKDTSNFSAARLGMHEQLLKELRKELWPPSEKFPISVYLPISVYFLVSVYFPISVYFPASV